MDEIFDKSILYDLYGGLLTKSQQTVYEYHVNDDLSFNEIGEELGITRQAAYDLYVKADKKLKEIDEKLELRTRFEDIEYLTNEIKKNAKENKTIISLSDKIIQKILKGGND